MKQYIYNSNFNLTNDNKTKGRGLAIKLNPPHHKDFKKLLYIDELLRIYNLTLNKLKNKDKTNVINQSTKDKINVINQLTRGKINVYVYKYYKTRSIYV